MPQLLLNCGFVLLCVLFSVEAQGNATTQPPHGMLECRLCSNALYLEDCTETRICPPNYECYIDEIVTSQLHIIFNAGCRLTTICRALSAHSRKRDNLVACSYCCNDHKSTNGTECNTKYCGLKAGNVTTSPRSKCRICWNALCLEDCTETEQCLPNEECFIDQLVTPEMQIVFNAGCRSSMVCTHSSVHTRKRAEGVLVACSHCCNDSISSISSNGTECNTNFCGLKPRSLTKPLYGPLECRVCRNARYLEECNETQLCPPFQDCYIDEIVTPQLQIVFNAGCTLTTLCGTSNFPSGKRADSPMVTCSRCCNDRISSNGTECNTKLCGLKTKDNYNNKCYYCGDDANHISVNDVRKCRKIKTCADDEVCHVKTINYYGTRTFEFGCEKKLTCQALTIQQLMRQGIRISFHSEYVFGSVDIIGKRQVDVCDVCCGDGLCNDESCESVTKRIVYFASRNRFNYTTLKLTP